VETRPSYCTLARKVGSVTQMLIIVHAGAVDAQWSRESIGNKDAEMSVHGIICTSYPYSSEHTECAGIIYSLRCTTGLFM
jgi:hypothetical protein